MEFALVLVILLALGCAYLLYRAGRSARTAAGIPADAAVVYSDTGAWERVEKPLFARRYRLTGKPDYLVEQADGALIPIEVKPNRSDAQPRESDTMQLVAYGVLVEETYGARPDYGLLKYRDRMFRIEFTDARRAALFETMREMRAARGSATVHRTHDDPRRCRYCGYREECDERLVE